MESIVRTGEVLHVEVDRRAAQKSIESTKGKDNNALRGALYGNSDVALAA